jgi:hypothetical protein
VGAVAGYVVALVVFPGSVPLLAPLTALLVIQLTPVSLFISGIQRVASVVAGVAVAVTFTSLVQLTWWSLGIVIALSLLIGQVLRLGSNLLEVPISAMLVLGVGATAAEVAAAQRISETLVGAGVGVLSNLLFPPRVATEDAGGAIEGLADNLARLLERAAGELTADSPVPMVDRAVRWLDDARRLTHDMPQVGGALLLAERSRRLNLRALGTPDTGPGLRHGLEALEHTAVTVRSLCRSLLDAARDRAERGDEFDADLRGVFAVLLDELAAAVRSCGRLVRAEAHPWEPPPDLDEPRQALEGLHEARARVTDLLFVNPRDDGALTQLNFALLTAVDRMHRELDLGERIRRQERRPGATPRRVVPRPGRHGSRPAQQG